MPEIISVLSCPSCGHLDPGPRENCPACFATGLKPCNVQGVGNLVSWTMIRRPPTAFRSEGEYAVAVVALDAGVQVTGRLELTEDEVRPGARVAASKLQADVPLFLPCD
ncbi:MAG: OB-fold domain-containing protein [Pseudomonadota bacterium]